MKWESTDAFRSWVCTLKSGDTVCVFYASTGEPIYTTRVRVTMTGRIYLLGRGGKLDGRTDWSRSTTIECPGGGTRCIGPIPKNCTLSHIS